MPGESDDVEPRVSALEREAAEARERLDQVAEDAAAGRVLAAGADRDVSEVKAELGVHLRLLNALGESQAEMRTELREFKAETRAEFAAVRAEMRNGFAEMRAGFAAIAALIGRIAPE